MAGFLPVAGESVRSMVSARRCRENLHRRARRRGFLNPVTPGPGDSLHLGLLGDLQGVLDLDAKVSDCAFQPMS
jgi:hypothetical protein